MTGHVFTIDTRCEEGRAAMRGFMRRMSAPANPCEAAARDKARARGLELRAVPWDQRPQVQARHQAEDDAQLAKSIGPDALAFIRNRYPNGRR